MENLNIRRLVIASLGVLLLAGNAWAFWPFYAATREMRSFCEELPKGSSWQEVVARAASHGYTVTSVSDGRAVAEDPVSYGRRECQLRFDTGGLSSAFQE